MKTVYSQQKCHIDTKFLWFLWFTHFCRKILSSRFTHFFRRILETEKAESADWVAFRMYAPREFSKSPPKSPKPPTTNRGNYMESRFLTISREVTWLILSLPNLCITHKSQLMEMWRKASYRRKIHKSSASENLIEGKHRRRKWKKFCVGNLNYDFPPLQLTQLVCSWFLSLDLLTHPISPPQLSST